MINLIHKTFKKYIESGVLKNSSNDNSFNVTLNIPAKTFNTSFYGVYKYCNYLKDVSFPNLTSIGNGGLQCCFESCTSLTSISFPNVTTIGNYGLNDCFYKCSSLTTAPTFDKLTSIGNYGLNDCFYKCSSLTTSPTFSNLTSIGENGLSRCFEYCYKLTTAPTFANLTTIGSGGLYYCFNNTKITSLSFPALTSSSFGSDTSQFDGMLSGVTGCTVHFPSNLQSVIGSWDSVTNGFGGTNTTVLFDLPATS